MSKILVTFCLLGSILSLNAASAQQKRAVLVGINNYTPTASSDAIALRKWKDLEGAVNDIDAMAALLDSKFSFDQLTVLKDTSATRNAILTAIEELAAVSKPGDVALFYYAGHGSQMRNTASLEQDGLDETIVPYDVIRGASDIRDKELRDAFNTLIDRGALVTLIFDSCHSGSITRGIKGGQTRYLAPSPIVVSDASNPPRPEDRGALVISAAQDDELASELIDADGNARGAFSWALGQSLLNADPDETAGSMFLKLRALMKSKGIKQEPVIAGLQNRINQPLFGGKESDLSSKEVLVASIEGSDIYIQGGLATGIREGTELVSESGGRYVVEQTIGMSQSIAVALEGSTLPGPAQKLTIDKWISSAAAPLRIQVAPNTLEYEKLEALAKDWKALKSVSDPTETVPNHILAFDGAWKLTASDGTVTDLGSGPSSKQIESSFIPPADGSPVTLFISYPPFEIFGDRLLKDVETAGRGSALVQEVGQAEYFLSGMWNGTEFLYAWVLREAVGAGSQSPAPPRTDWRTVHSDRLIASSVLTTDLGKLDVIWGWLNLESPPDDTAFPYALTAFENVETGHRKMAGDSLAVGEQYRLILTTTNKRIQDAQMNAVINNVGKRFMYVFALDRNGNGALLYPLSNDGNVENDLNYFTNLPLEMSIPAKGSLFTVSPPVGVDSFFLMSTAEPIPQPDILNFSGVRTRSTPEGEQSDLSRLLFDLGGGKRSVRKPVPLNWSIEKITVISVDNQ